MGVNRTIRVSGPWRPERDASCWGLLFEFEGGIVWADVDCEIRLSKRECVHV